MKKENNNLDNLICNVLDSINQETHLYINHLLDRLGYLRSYEKRLLKNKPFIFGNKKYYDELTNIQREIAKIEKKLDFEHKELTKYLKQ